jgi:hypothetical protein
MLRERADDAARAIGHYPPESGRDSNGRPFSIDIGDLPNNPQATGSNPLPTLPPAIVFYYDSNAGSNCDADSSDLSSSALQHLGTTSDIQHHPRQVSN